MPCPGIVMGTGSSARLDHATIRLAIEVIATVDRPQVERARRLFGQRLRRTSKADDATGQRVAIKFLHLEDVRALLPFGSSITVHGPTDAKKRLHDLADELAEHYRPSGPPAMHRLIALERARNRGRSGDDDGV